MLSAVPSALDLLAPYFQDLGRPNGGDGASAEAADRWVSHCFADAPPDVALRALNLFDEGWASMRGNGQPPNAWLARQAAQRAGRVGGVLGRGGARETFRVDTVSVDRSQADSFIEAVRTDFPDPWVPSQPESATAIEVMLVITFASWDSSKELWSGSADAFQAERPEGQVVSFWWD